MSTTSFAFSRLLSLEAMCKTGTEYRVVSQSTRNLAADHKTVNRRSTRSKVEVVGGFTRTGCNLQACQAQSCLFNAYY